MTLRAATQADAPRIGAIAEASGLFPASMIEDMIAPAFVGGSDRWLVNEDVTGFAFARPEEMTDRVWNLLALGVDPEARGEGLGARLVEGVEAAIPDWRMIIIETTQTEDQAAARALYTRLGYAHEATLKGFYADGEDKLTFVKRRP